MEANRQQVETSSLEAYRLLGRAHHALGARAAACEAADKAAAEAATARYVWLEFMSLRDLLRWSEAGAQAEGVCERIHGVARRLVVSQTEIEAVPEL